MAKAPLLFPGGEPKSGPVALTDVTPLLAAVTGASPELVKTLLDGGAAVNAKDGRGLTPERLDALAALLGYLGIDGAPIRRIIHALDEAVALEVVNQPGH